MYTNSCLAALLLIPGLPALLLILSLAALLLIPGLPALLLILSLAALLLILGLPATSNVYIVVAIPAQHSLKTVDQQ